MKKLWIVARQELVYHLRQWAFYITLIGMPLAFAALGAVPQLADFVSQTPLANVETILTEAEITDPTGYVDEAGIVTTVPENFFAFETRAEAAAALQNGSIESYYVIAADYVENGTVYEYSDTPQLVAQTDMAFSELLRENLLQQLDDPDLVARVDDPITLTRQGPEPAVFSFLPSDFDMARLLSAGLVAGLFAYVTSIGGNLLVRALEREVRDRVIEIMVVHTTPLQFIGGKIIALASIALIQAGAALGAGALVYGQNPESGPSDLPVFALVMSMPYLVLGFLAYCGMVMSVAATWPNLRSNAAIVLVMRLLALSPLVGVLFILPNLEGTLTAVLTLFPFTSALLMPFRLVLSPVPVWQWILGFVLLLGWAFLWIGFSARLFRMQSLLTGRPLTLKSLWQSLAMPSRAG